MTKEEALYKPTSDDLIIKGAKGIKDGLYNIQNGELFQYKAKGGTVRTYPIVEALSAWDGDLISRQEAVEEITDMVNNAQQKGGKFDLAVSYGLLGAREVIKDLPSAEPVQGEYCPNCGAKMDGDTE